MVICLEQGADLHTAQLMPLPLPISCFIKIQIGYTFLVPAYPGCPGKEAVKWLLLLLLLPTSWRRKPAGIEITPLSPCVYTVVEGVEFRTVDVFHQERRETASVVNELSDIHILSWTTLIV